MKLKKVERLSLMGNNMRNLIRLFAAVILSCCAVQANDDYVPMIKEGYVWEYAGAYFLTNEDGVVHHFMKFDESITLNGKEYTSFVLFKSDLYCKYVNGKEEKSERTEMRNGPRFFVREENSKVYVLTKDSQIYYTTSETSSDWIPTASDSSPYEEFAIYDFSAAEGAEAPAIMNGQIYKEDTNLVINWLTPVSVWGVNYRAYQFLFDEEQSTSGNAIVIEGIGITGNGHLACFDSYLSTAIFTDNYFMPGQGSFLVSVRDADGKYIYGSPDLGSISDISSDAQGDQPVYDVMGRVVKEMVPGSVYIRGGKKFVAK